jgi:two-component system nitrate/nitrite response regulator NarL
MLLIAVAHGDPSAS